MKHIKHLVIQQKGTEDGGSVETVSSAVIAALYNLSKDEQLVYDQNDLKGDLQCAATYQQYIDRLHTQYPSLNITANSVYVYFADSEVNSILANRYGDGVGVPQSSLVGISIIPENLFKENTTIVSFDELATAFPNVTALSKYSFLRCTSLESIDIKNISNIPLGCFQQCDSLQNVGDYFSNVQSLSDWCFARTALIELDQNNNITSIPSSAFRECRSLISADFPNCTTIANEAFMSCDNLSTVGNMKPTTLNESAFNRCYALRFVDISEVTSLAARYIFYDCDNLGPSIDIASATGKIGAQCFFSNGALVEVRNASGITEIEGSAFKDCRNLTTIDLSNVTAIGDGAFHNDGNLVSVNLSSCQTITGNYAFCYTGIQTLSLPVCTSIENASFHQCRSLTSVSIPSCITLGNHTFNNCPALSSITLPNTLTTIGNNCFSESGFTGYFTIPSSVTSMGEKVFDKCWNITGYIFEGTTPPSFPNGITNMFITHDNQHVLQRPIYVPDSAVTAYQQAFADNADYVAAVTPVSQKPS